MAASIWAADWAHKQSKVRMVGEFRSLRLTNRRHEEYIGAYQALAASPLYDAGKQTRVGSARHLPLAWFGPRLTPAHQPGSSSAARNKPSSRNLAYLDVRGRPRNLLFRVVGRGPLLPDRRSDAQNARPQTMHELHYGFSEHFFYLRVDPSPSHCPR